MLILDAFAVNNERTIEESMTFEFDSKNATNTLTTKIRRIYFYLTVFSNEIPQSLYPIRQLIKFYYVSNLNLFGLESKKNIFEKSTIVAIFLHILDYGIFMAKLLEQQSV